MKLSKLEVNYNPNSFADYDGTPPKSYSGKITLSQKIGTTSVLLTEQDIVDIVKIIAARVADRMVELAKTVESDVASAVTSNTLEEGTQIGVN